ncbi:MAG: hemolysin family protein [Bacteroidetes bacterium]|nr:hemolysin family protein [Bacteroidota bacterium]
MICNILLTLLFVLANAFFVAGEFAIVKVRLSQLKVRVKQGSKLAKYAENIVHNLDSYLSATQLGITLSSLGLGWIGESVVSKIIISLLSIINVSISLEAAHSIALPTAFVLISFLHIVFGELAPKSIAIIYSENVTLGLSIPLKIIHFVFKPFIVLLNGTANLFLKIFGIRVQNETEEPHSSEELRVIIEESTKGGTIKDTESKLIENIFDFKSIPVKQIMIPRNKIIALKKDSDINDILNCFIDCGYSRIPVYDADIDNIVGVIFSKDLLKFINSSVQIELENILREPITLNEDDLIQDVLIRMQKTHIQIAIVLNEFGGTAGLITLEDIIEEIVGEIQDEYDDEEELVEEKLDGAVDISASITINDVNDVLKEPLPESEVYETLGGYILHSIGRIPNENEQIAIGQHTFTIIESNERKIEKVRIKEIVQLD